MPVIKKTPIEISNEASKMDKYIMIMLPLYYYYTYLI